MIDHVRGRVLSVGIDGAVLEVGGIGLRVVSPAGVLLHLRVGEEALLPTSLVVREDSWTLFGFASAEQRADFEVCQSVPGVGPKVALAIVATLTPGELRRAVDRSDLVALTRVPGVGRKGAARIAVELAGRLGPAPAGAAGEPEIVEGWRDAVVAGLTSLGWSAREAESAADTVAGLAGAQPDVPTLLRAALQSLRGSS